MKQLHWKLALEAKSTYYHWFKSCLWETLDFNESLGEEEFREWVSQDTHVQRMLVLFQSMLRAENTSGQTTNSSTVKTSHS